MDFSQDVEDLPIGPDALPHYINFIKAYGTHFVSDVVMGAKAILQNVFDKNEYSAMRVKCLHMYQYIS